MGEEDLAELIDGARGAWAAMRAEPGYVEPAPYVPRPRRKPVPEELHRGPPTAAMAARWEASARDFELRCPRPASMPEILFLWRQYEFRWTKPPAHLPLPLEEMHPLGLAPLQWHSVFQRAQAHCDRKERIGDKVNHFPPYELILTIARKEAKRRKQHAWRLKQIHFARSRGELDEGPQVDVEEVELDEEDED